MTVTINGIRYVPASVSAYDASERGRLLAALDAEIQTDDGVMTMRQCLCRVLDARWIASTDRLPFITSDWRSRVIAALIEADYLTGHVQPDITGYVGPDSLPDPDDDDAAERFVRGMIAAMSEAPAADPAHVVAMDALRAVVRADDECVGDFTFREVALRAVRAALAWSPPMR